MAKTRRAPPRLKIEVAGKVDNVPFDTFIAVAKDALQILQELDREVSLDDRGTIRWEIVRARLNSPLLVEIAPTSTSFIDVAGKVVAKYINGISRLNESDDTPPHFSDLALKAAKNMASLYNDGAGKIKFSAPGRKVVIPRPQIIEHVDKIFRDREAPPEQGRERKPRWMVGSLEGQIIILKSGTQDHFTLRERLSGEDVKCSFPIELEETVRRLWKRRVLIYGRLHYSESRIPQQAKVDDIRELRSSAVLPQFKDFGLNITGGVESAEYVRGLRDGD